MWIVGGDSYGLGAANDTSFPSGYPGGAVWTVTATPSFAVLAEPTGIYAEAGPGGSPGGFFGWRRWQSTGRPQIIVNIAKGATRTNQWLSGTFIDKAVANTQWALRHPGATLKGVLWIQGANNAIQAESEPGQNWSADMDVIEQQLRGLPGGAGMPWVVGVLQPAKVPQAPTQEAWDDVIDQQNEWVGAGLNRYSFVLPSAPMTTNGLHQETPANLVIGEDMLNIVAPIVP